MLRSGWITSACTAPRAACGVTPQLLKPPHAAGMDADGLLAESSSDDEALESYAAAAAAITLTVRQLTGRTST